MDKLSPLSDDLIIKILSLVPTKDAIATSVLSKRWMSLWKLVPKLTFDDYLYGDEDLATNESHWRNLSHNIYGTLVFHKAPVLDTFHLNVASERLAFDIDLWVRIAVERSVRDLKICFNRDHAVVRLPSSFFQCKTLETLELHMVVISEIPSRLSFRSLKTLHLLSVKYLDAEYFCRIISSCLVLEDLVVECCPDDNVVTFFINGPSLHSLTIKSTFLEEDGPDNHLFVIHSHSLKILNILDYFGRVDVIGNMSELVEANLHILRAHDENVVKYLNYVKRLSLCLHVQDQYPIGNVFFRLVRLELCMCLENWSKLLVYMLQHSPKLQFLKLVMTHWMVVDRKVGWIQPSFVPECLWYHLKTFECSYYDGFEEENEVAIYILKNARGLVTGTIDLDSATINTDPVKLARKLKVFEEMEHASRGFRTCELILD